MHLPLTTVAVGSVYVKRQDSNHCSPHVQGKLRIDHLSLDVSAIFNNFVHLYRDFSMPLVSREKKIHSSPTVGTIKSIAEETQNTRRRHTEPTQPSKPHQHHTSHLQ